MRSKFLGIGNTLGGKLSIWFLGSLGLIMLVFLSVNGFFFGRTLQEQIDHHIHITVNEAREIVQNYRGVEREELLKNLVSAQGMTIIVLSPDGAPMIETNSPDVAFVSEHQLQGIMSSSRLDDSNPEHFTVGNIRFAALPVLISDGGGILAVGYSTQVLNATFVRMLGILGSTIVFLVLPITFVGYQMLKRQLRPLESIANQARTISERKKLNTRIRIESATLEIASIQEALNMMLVQLEEKFRGEQEFFSDAAHTLKTPLAVLRSQIEKLSYQKKLKSEMLSTIDLTGKSIEDLLILSKIRIKQSPETFSLSELMESLSELAITLGDDKNLKVISEIEEKVFLRADRGLVFRALGNLVHNAVTYSRAEGKIVIVLKVKAQKILIAIEDSGVGIAKKDMKYVFGRFYRGANQSVGGSGLGLAISKAVIESLGGQISLDSKIGRGTRVLIVLNG